MAYPQGCEGPEELTLADCNRVPGELNTVRHMAYKDLSGKVERHEYY